MTGSVSSTTNVNLATYTAEKLDQGIYLITVRTDVIYPAVVPLNILPNGYNYPPVNA